MRVVGRTFRSGVGPLAACLLALMPGWAAAQDTVAADPIQCWWRLDRSAIYVGEQFSLLLTCSVIDTEAVRVVVDEAALDPATVLLSPFDVLGGERYRDIRNNARRFFQHRYDLHLLGEEFFGRDVTLPRLELTYRIQSSVREGSAVTGLERRYAMPPEPVRVLSLVPRDSADIRDAPGDTFGDVEARFVRANLVLVAAGFALALGAILLIVTGARATRRYRAAVPALARTVPAAAIVRGASKELGAVQALSQRDGWTSALAGRAATAVRLAYAVALSQRITQSPVSANVKAREGQLVLPGWRSRMAVSASVTPVSPPPGGPGTPGARGALTDAGHAKSPRRGGASAIREDLSQALKVFTAARYGRPGSPLDSAALDQALGDSQQLVRQLRRQYWWPFTPVPVSSRTTTGGARAWAR